MFEVWTEFCMNFFLNLSAFKTWKIARSTSLSNHKAYNYNRLLLNYTLPPEYNGTMRYRIAIYYVEVSLFLYPVSVELYYYTHHHNIFQF